MSKQQRLIVYSVLLCVLIFFVLPFTLLIGNYGFSMLISIPFGIGVLFSLLVSTHKTRSLRTIFAWSIIPLALVVLSCITIAGEGAICLIIMGALLLFPYFAGIVIGYLVQYQIWRSNALLVLIVLVMTSSTTPPAYNESRQVSDTLLINAPPAVTWQVLTQRTQFGKSSDFFFKNGVAHPHSMQLITQENQKFLEVAYNHGTLKAPIRDFQEGRLFSFELNDSIVTMEEKNFYNESNTMHLKKHFLIEYGQFEIIPLNSRQCRLVATSAFQHKFKPAFYTNLWVDYFLHNLHAHVLSAVKHSSESQSSLNTVSEKGIRR